MGGVGRCSDDTGEMGGSIGRRLSAIPLAQPFDSVQSSFRSDARDPTWTVSFGLACVQSLDVAIPWIHKRDKFWKSPPGGAQWPRPPPSSYKLLTSPLDATTIGGGASYERPAVTVRPVRPAPQTPGGRPDSQHALICACAHTLCRGILLSLLPRREPKSHDESASRARGHLCDLR